MEEITKEKLKLYGLCAANCLLGAACFGACSVIDEFLWLPAILGGLSFTGIGVRGFYEAYNIFQGEEAEARAKASRAKSQKGRSLTHSLSKGVVKAGSKQDGLLTRAFSRPAKSPEREVKAKELLKTMQARDLTDKEITVKSYQKQKGGR